MIYIIAGQPRVFNPYSQIVKFCSKTRPQEDELSWKSFSHNLSSTGRVLILSVETGLDRQTDKYRKNQGFPQKILLTLNKYPRRLLDIWSLTMMKTNNMEWQRSLAIFF